ncbi:Carbon monoxide dehydrogenase large chain [Baekduia alba]|uniref:xanthine dehydrogenase family protein molybdopterin-binding subunit n=1 Tax=Baekduia alba TaxID=2997333 RepID=UPI0023417E6F|nr:xanthine dehydrogenase family protein molybdopterin-binding subunit [Baekduia alba]WCB96696.1 Carbon monoxide dehydrogenase large chain [Baekduia alba]
MATVETETHSGPLIGRPMRRKEDMRLLTGRARFLEDIKLPGTLFASVLRSPHAHARIRGIDVERARSMPGVHAVLTGRDLDGKVVAWGHQTQALPVGERLPFALDKVYYEGQEIAAVVADSKHLAADALEAIEVDYEILPAVVDVEAAMEPGAPQVIEHIDYPRGEGNVFDLYKARIGDIAEAEREAAVHVRGTFVTNRPHGAALEVHGCIADYDTREGHLTVYSSTQSVYLLRDLLAESLHVPANRIRVMAYDIGAGFGSKADLFQHEVIASVLAMMLGRPVQLVLSRADVFRATTARCNQVRYAELFVAADGMILGYRDRIVHNAGAVSMWGNQILPLGTHIGLAAYPIPNVYIDGYAVHTNTTSGGALRAFGVPQQIFPMESLVEMAAKELGMHSAELRMKNVPRAEECPRTSPMGHYIDSTSIHACIQKVTEAIGWDEHRANRRPGEGLGMAIALKHTSCRHPSVDTDVSSVRMKIETDGTVTLHSSDVPHGQGHETMVSQIVGDILGVDFDKIRVRSSDTETTVFGLGTWGSRGAAILGAAVQAASERVRERMLQLAGHLLEVNPDDLEVGGDRVFVKGSPNSGMSIAEVAGVAGYATHSLPEGFEPGSLEATATYDSPTDLLTDESYGNISVTYSGGAHAGRVHVDVETGIWKIVDYAMVHDTGVVVNPLIVDGQHHGGFLHGFGMVFGEGLRYDDEGHMLNPSFATYAAPYAPDLPDLSNLHEIPAPSRVVPGGRKGAGESATAQPPAVVANAIEDAIGIRFTILPITPDHVLAALREKERRGVDHLTYPYDVADAPGPHEWRGVGHGEASR